MLGLQVDDIENINTWHAKSTISAMKILQECAEWIEIVQDCSHRHQLWLFNA